MIPANCEECDWEGAAKAGEQSEDVLLMIDTEFSQKCCDVNGWGSFDPFEEDGAIFSKDEIERDESLKVEIRDSKPYRWNPDE